MSRASDSAVQERFEVAVEAARRARRILAAAAEAGPSAVRRKGPRDYQTDLDVEVERVIVDAIDAAFATDRVLGEELGERGRETGTATWFVDPVDGTRNLVSGRAEVSVSIACYSGPDPLVAVVDLPRRDVQLRWRRGSAVRVCRTGAEHDLVTPSDAPSLEHALVGLPGDFRSDADTEVFRRLTAELAGRVDAVRVTGGMVYDLASVALGELDARVSLRCHDVDVAAGAVLVAQAGGLATDLSGRPWRPGSSTLAAARDPQLHAEILAHIRRA